MDNLKEMLLMKHHKFELADGSSASFTGVSVSFCQTPNSSLSCSASVRPTQGLADGSSSIVYCTAALYKVPGPGLV